MYKVEDILETKNYRCCKIIFMVEIQINILIINQQKKQITLLSREMVMPQNSFIQPKYRGNHIQKFKLHSNASGGINV